MSADDKITLNEFIEEVWKVEHVKLQIKNIQKGITYLINHYPYTEPMDGDCTVDEFLDTRIRPLLNSILAPEQVFVMFL